MIPSRPRGPPPSTPTIFAHRAACASLLHAFHSPDGTVWHPSGGGRRGKPLSLSLVPQTWPELNKRLFNSIVGCRAQLDAKQPHLRGELITRGEVLLLWGHLHFNGILETRRKCALMVGSRGCGRLTSGGAGLGLEDSLFQPRSQSCSERFGDMQPLGAVR